MLCKAITGVVNPSAAPTLENIGADPWSTMEDIYATGSDVQEENIHGDRFEVGEDDGEMYIEVDLNGTTEGRRSRAAARAESIAGSSITMNDSVAGDRVASTAAFLTKNRRHLNEEDDGIFDHDILDTSSNGGDMHFFHDSSDQHSVV